MHLVKKSIVVFISAWLSIVVFSPKNELYDYAKDRLEKSGIVVSEKKITENVSGIELERVDISYKNKKILSFDSMKIWTLLFYTHFRIENLKLSSGNHSTPVILTRVEAHHLLWNPFDIRFTGKGSSGKIVGEINLKKRVISFHFVGRIERLGTLRNYLKKDREGWSFEYKF